MNEEYGFNYGGEEEASATPETPEIKNDIPGFDAEINDVLQAEAQIVEEPKASESSYQQANYSPYSSQPYSSYNYSQPVYYQQPSTPPQAPKSKKGMKVFVACIAVLIVFALGFGAASIVKSINKADPDEKEIENIVEGLPEVSINESPVSPTGISKGGILTPAQIAAKLAPSNVGIVVYTRNSNSSAGEGSGVIMGEDESGTYTYIITCAHVISDAGISARVQLDNGTTYDAEIVGFDTRTDLGVLKIKAKGLPAAEFGNSSALVVGDPVYAIGNPGGVELFGSFTSGYVSSIDRPVNSEIGYTMKSIQHSAAISPGNSGGMLVNAYGQVIGINSQKIAATDYEGIGFAIPISSAKDIIENLINHGYVPDRPMLGITYYPVSASAQYSMIAQIKGLPAGTLIINEIDPEGALANTEARQYDMITEVDGKPLTTADVLLERIDNGKVGDKMILTLCRVNSNYSIDEFELEIALVEDKGGSEPITTTQAYYIDPFEYFNQFGF